MPDSNEPKPQIEKFRDLARELETDDNEKRAKSLSRNQPTRQRNLRNPK